MKSTSYEQRNLFALFKVADKLITEQAMPSGLLTLVCIFDYFQILSFIISDHFSNIWGSGLIFNYVASIMSCFNLNGILSLSSSTIYVPLYFICLSIILVHAAMLLYFYMKARLKEDLRNALIGPMSAITYCLTTILYLPLLQLFLVQYECSPVNGSLYTKALPSVQCFSGITIFFSFSSALVLIIYIPMVVVSTLMIYEDKVTPNDFFGKYTVKNDMLILILKSLIALAHFLGEVTNSVHAGIICMFLIGSLIFCTKRRIHISSNVNSLIYSVLVCSTFLSLALILGYAFTFDYFFESCLICVPLLFACVRYWAAVQEYVFNKYETYSHYSLGDVRIIEEARKINEAFQKLDTRRYRLWLAGKILGHAVKCNRKNCDIIQRNVPEIEKLINSLVNGNTESKEKMRALTLSYSKRQFVMGISKNYKNINLRLNYCLFIIEELHNPLIALAELKEIETMDCSILDRFLIYRYSKLAKSKKCSGEDKNSSQQLIGIQQQTIIDSFEDLLVDITHKYITLWGYLEDETPDYTRVVENCFLLLDQLDALDKLYFVMHREKVKNYRIYMLYSSFFADVLHEETKSKKIMAIAEDFGQSRIVNNGLLKDLNSAEIKHITDETPLILVSGNENDTGVIINCNSSLGKLFGYGKDELIGKDISMLMPDIYIKTHTEMLKEKKFSDERKEENFILCSNRNKYIFPAYLKVLRMATMLNSFTYVATITDRLPFANSKRAYVILNQKLQLVSLSSYSCELLKLSNSRIKDGDVNLNLFCPDINLANISDYYSGWKEVVFFLPQNRYNDSRIRLSHEGSLDEKKNRMNELAYGSSKITLMFTAGPIKFSFCGIIGYFGIFFNPNDTLEVDDQTQNALSVIINKAGQFQFRYDPILNIFMRELSTDAEGTHRSFSREDLKTSRQRSIAHDHVSPRSSYVSESKKRRGSFYEMQDSRVKYLSQFVTEQNKDSKRITNEVKEFIDEYEQKQRIDYGEGVKTYRLVNKEFIEVNERLLLQSAMEEAEAVNYSRGAMSKKDVKKVKSVTMLLDSIKSKKALMNILKQISLPSWMKIVLCIIIIGLLFIIGIRVFLAVLAKDDMLLDEENLEMVYFLTPITEHLLLSHHCLREMLLVAQKNFTATSTYYGKTPAAYYEDLRAELDYESQMIIQTSHEFYKEMAEPLNRATLYFLNTIYSSMKWPSSAAAGTTSVSARILAFTYFAGAMYYNIINRTMSELNANNAEEMFELNLIAPRLYKTMLNEGKKVCALLLNQNFSITNETYIVSSISLAFVTALMIIIMYSYKLVVRCEGKILKTYLDVPFRQAHKQILLCQNFINIAKNEGADNDGNSEDSPSQFQRKEIDAKHENLGMQKRRIFKGEVKLTYIEVVVILFVYLIFVANFSLLIILAGYFKDTMYKYAQNFIYILDAPHEFPAALVVQREYFYNKSSTFNRGTSKAYSVTYLETIQNSTKKLMFSYKFSRSMLSEEGANIVHDILYGNLCKKYPFPPGVKLDCPNYANNVLTKGVSLSAVHYESLLRTNLEDFLNAKEVTPKDAFNVDKFNIPNILVKYILIPAARDIRYEFYEGALNYCETSAGFNVIITLLFSIVTVICIVIIIWISMKITIRQSRLRSSLILLPLKILKKIRRFRKYLQHNVPSESLILGSMMNEQDQ